MLANDPKLNALAKKRLNELDRAFEYLTDPKKFRDFHELVNDKIAIGTLEPGSLAASIARREGFTPRPNKQSSSETTEVISDAPPGEGHTTLAEEREALKELRRKRLEKAPRIGHKRVAALEKLVKETFAAIEHDANAAARAKASELVARGYTDSDAFFEQVYAAALEVASATRDRALQVIEQKDLPVDEKLLDDWETAVLDKSEEAAEGEYSHLEGVMASVKTSVPGSPKFMVKLAITLCTVAAALCVFCNVNVAVMTNQPDALGQQRKAAGGGSIGYGDTFEILRQLPEHLTSNLAIANADGMVLSAGTAGAAPNSTTLAIDGAADYNVGTNALGKNKFEESVISFNNAIKKNQNVYQYFYNRAMAWLSRSHYQAALTDFDAAITLRSDLMQARYNKGVIYLLGGADSVNRLSHAKKEDQAAYRRQAEINLRAAIAEFTTVSTNMPNLAQPLYNRALARYRFGDIKGAIADFQAAEKKDAGMTAATFNLQIAKSALAAPDGKPVIPPGTTPSAPIGPQGPPAPGFF